VDARTGIDTSRWTNDPEILALLDRRIAEINEFADRIERAQAALRAYIVAHGVRINAAQMKNIPRVPCMP
jgi:hypothetical protein